jgi:arylamine N-acetyltransferase
MAAIDLDAYFRRIGYTGSRDPTRDVLARSAMRSWNCWKIPSLSA